MTALSSRMGMCGIASRCRAHAALICRDFGGLAKSVGATSGAARQCRRVYARCALWRGVNLNQSFSNDSGNWPQGGLISRAFKGMVARLTGLEPATPGVTGRYSNQLSYNRAGYTFGVGRMARLTGLEPATPGVTGRYSNQLSYNRTRPPGSPNVGWVLRKGAGGVKRPLGK